MTDTLVINMAHECAAVTAQANVCLRCGAREPYKCRSPVDQHMAKTVTEISDILRKAKRRNKSHAYKLAIARKRKGRP